MFGLVIILIFGCLVFPVFILIRTIRSEKLSPGARTGWVISQLIFFPVLAYFYGLFVEPSRKIRIFSALMIVLSGIGIFHFSKDFLASIQQGF